MALRLNPSPTFSVKVGIPVPGQEQAEQIVCVFKHMTRDEYAAFSSPEQADARSDLDSLCALLAGWEGVDAPFSRDALAKVLQAYHGAAHAIATAYVTELTKARLGN